MSRFIVNSFQLPNAVVDELLRDISPNALKCYLVIVRKTIGWQKEWDKISTSQLMELTGIKKRTTIYNATQELIDLNLIIADKEQGKLTSFKVVPFMGTSTVDGTEPVPSMGTTTSTVDGYTTKDNIKNNKQNAYTAFLTELKSSCKYKSKVTSTKDGEKLFKQIEDKEQLAKDYLHHQETKGEFAVRITKFMEDYNTVYKSNNSSSYTF